MKAMVTVTMTLVVMIDDGGDVRDDEKNAMLVPSTMG